MLTQSMSRLQGQMVQLILTIDVKELFSNLATFWQSYKTFLLHWQISYIVCQPSLIFESGAAYVNPVYE